MLLVTTAGRDRSSSPAWVATPQAGSLLAALEIAGLRPVMVVPTLPQRVEESVVQWFVRVALSVDRAVDRFDRCVPAGRRLQDLIELDTAVELLAETEEDFLAARRAVAAEGCLASAEQEYAQLAARGRSLDPHPRRAHFRA